MRYFTALDVRKLTTSFRRTRFETPREAEGAIQFWIKESYRLAPFLPVFSLLTSQECPFEILQRRKPREEALRDNLPSHLAFGKNDHLFRTS
jgi:hypothetical protein